MPTKKIPYVTNYPKPTGLGTEASRMWEWALTTYELRPDECRLLKDLCHEIMVVNRLEKALEGAPEMVKGSQGQEVSNPLFAEVRQHRLAIGQLVKQLAFEKRKVYKATAEGKTNAENVVEMASKWRNIAAKAVEGGK